MHAHSTSHQGKNENLLEGSRIRRRAAATKDVAVKVWMSRVKLFEVRRKELVPVMRNPTETDRSGKACTAKMALILLRHADTI